MGRFSRQQIDIFLIFPRKQDLTIFCKLSPWGQFAQNVKSCFLGKIGKIFQNVVCWKFYLECQTLRIQTDGQNGQCRPRSDSAESGICKLFFVTSQIFVLFMVICRFVYISVMKRKVFQQFGLITWCAVLFKVYSKRWTSPLYQNFLHSHRYSNYILEIGHHNSLQFLS